MVSKLPPDYYYIGIDLANIQAIKMLCQHITLKEPDLQMYRAAILNLARQAETDCYKLINQRKNGEDHGQELYEEQY